MSHLQCGATIAANDAIYIDSGTGKIHKYDPTDTTKVFAGIAKEAGVLNGFIRVVQSGRIRGFTGLTSGAFVYASVSVPGSFQLAEPPSFQKVILGIAKSATELVVNGGLGIKPGGAGGAGSINYIPDGSRDAEGGIGSWVRYLDAAAAIPVDGVGGAANITLTSSAVSPLRGVSSFLITKDAVNRQGEGVSIPFTIDPADQGKILRASFDLSSSANYVDGGARVYVYDITNARMIELIDRDLQANANGAYLGSFQTSIDSVSYRLIIHVASVSALAYTLKFDNVIVGPQTLSKGAVVTDWINFTPTVVPTNTTATGVWRRVGDSMQIRYMYAYTGLPNGNGGGIMNMPTGYSIDTSKIANSLQLGAEGSALFYDASSGFTYSLIAVPNSTSQIRMWMGQGTTGIHTPTVPVTVASGDYTTVDITVPIVGWSSNLTLSEDGGTRLIAASYSGNAAEAMTASTDIPFATRDYDYTGSWNGTQFTAPEAGIYDFSGSVRTASVSTTVSSFIGAASPRSASSPSTSALLQKFDGSRFLLRGQILSFRLGNSIGLLNTADHWVVITKRSSPQTLAGSETVAARAVQSSGQSIAVAGTIVTWDSSKTIDTHNALNTSTGLFTAPSSGLYLISAMILFNSVGWSVGNEPYLIVNKNGATYAALDDVTIQAASTVYVSLVGATTVPLLKGETLALKAFSAGSSKSLYTSAFSNNISITRIGN